MPAIGDWLNLGSFLGGWQYQSFNLFLWHGVLFMPWRCWNYTTLSPIVLFSPSFSFPIWPCSGDVYRMQLRGYWKLKGDWRERIVSIQTILCRLMSSILESPRWYFSGWEWMHSSFMRWLPVTFSQQPFKVSIGVHQKTTW
jgi:hypothetical protein